MLPAWEDGGLGIFARVLAAFMLPGVLAGAVLVPHVLVEPKPRQGLDLAAPRVSAPRVVVSVPTPAPRRREAPRSRKAPARPVTPVTRGLKRLRVSGSRTRRHT